MNIIIDRTIWIGRYSVKSKSWFILDSFNVNTFKAKDTVIDSFRNLLPGSRLFL